MKKLLCLAILLIATSAHAGSYEDAADAEYACDMFGKLSAQNYRLKQGGVPYPTRQDDKGGWIKQAARFGYYEALDEKQAYMKIWARCKDSFNK